MAAAGPAEQADQQQLGRQMLFVSFWSIGLENIPEGTFVHRRMTAEEARRAIEEARQAGCLRGVSRDDLFAPYNEKKKRDHEQLCRVLGEHYGIPLSQNDFVLEDEVEGEPLCSIHPLALVEVDRDSSLLVVNCNYTLCKERKQHSLDFEIAPDSVTFHLFEAIDSNSVR